MSSQKVNQTTYAEVSGSLSEVVNALRQGVITGTIDLRNPSPISFNEMLHPKSQPAGDNLVIYVYVGTKEQGEQALLAKKIEEEGEDFASDSEDAEERQLMENVDQNDVRFLMPEHMPKYLRIDKDIKEGLIALARLVKKYSQFDVIGLDREINRKLELSLDRQSTEYKFHRRAIAQKLADAQRNLEESILLKDDII